MVSPKRSIRVILVKEINDKMEEKSDIKVSFSTILSDLKGEIEMENSRILMEKL